MAKKFERLIVHVGMHKTGSTTIQHMLEQMTSGPVGPMDMIDRNHTVGCSMWFGSALDQKHTLLNLGHSRLTGKLHLARIKRRVARQLRRSTQKELVISSEWLSLGVVLGQGRAVMLKRLKAEFEPHFDHIEIYGYVRPPLAYTTSASQETMKMRTYFHTPWPEYQKRFRPLRQVFGPRNVNLRVFDRSQLVDGDILADFQDWVGWPKQEFVVERTNPSMTLAGASLVFCYQTNRDPIDSLRNHRERMRAVATLGVVDGPRFALSRAITDDLFDKNAKDLKWMEKILGRPIRDRGMDGDDAPWAVGSEDDLKRTAARFAPVLFGQEPIDPPDDPEKANALAWDAIRQKLKI